MLEPTSSGQTAISANGKHVIHTIRMVLKEAMNIRQCFNTGFDLIADIS